MTKTYVCGICTARRAKSTAVTCPSCGGVSCKRCSSQYLQTLDRDPQCMFVDCRASWSMDFVAQVLGGRVARLLTTAMYKRLANAEKSVMVPTDVYKQLISIRDSVRQADDKAAAAAHLDRTNRVMQIAALRNVLQQDDLNLRHSFYKKLQQTYKDLAQAYGFDPNAPSFGESVCKGVFQHPLSPVHASDPYIHSFFETMHRLFSDVSFTAALHPHVTRWLSSTLYRRTRTRQGFETYTRIMDFHRFIMVSLPKKINACKTPAEAAEKYVNVAYLKSVEDAYGPLAVVTSVFAKKNINKQ
jgi:predicted RNA-binding Zn-ribbon protein involved in translation (DUF1610 family)